MRIQRIVSALALLLGIVLTGAASRAEETKPIQIALWSPAQIFAPKTSISGLRLNLLYGKNKDVMGLDLGLVNHVTGDFKGLQYGLVGCVEGKGVGWQDNVICISKEFGGAQTGLYNGADAMRGFQWGAVNRTKAMRGFQLGLINITERMHGLQIGLLNAITAKKTLPYLPIINWQFD